MPFFFKICSKILEDLFSIGFGYFAYFRLDVINIKQRSSNQSAKQYLQWRKNIVSLVGCYFAALRCCVQSELGISENIFCGNLLTATGNKNMFPICSKSVYSIVNICDCREG